MNPQELALQQVLIQIEPPWNETMYTLLKGYYFIFQPDTICEPKFSEGELALILLALKQREFALHWLVRLNKWIPNHPFPITPSSVAERYKVLGIALQKIYLLCQHTHDLYCQHSHKEREIKIPYKNAAEWFAAIHWELIYYIQLGGTLPGTLKSKCKKTLLRQSSLKEAQKLKVYDNPLLANSVFPAKYLLYEAAIELAEGRSGLELKYKKEYFKPFVEALKEEIRILYSPSFCNTYIRSDGKAVRQVGQGNHLEIIELPAKWKELGSHLLQ